MRELQNGMQSQAEPTASAREAVEGDSVWTDENVLVPLLSYKNSGERKMVKHNFLSGLW
jgi:hypothetical protein